jgi:hypothetical protein
MKGTSMLKRFIAALTAAVLSILLMTSAVSAGPSCWGQASAVFAQTGDLGQHSAGFGTPRLGLRNLARTLHDADIIPDDSMEALGGFVADEFGFTIDACA